MLNKTNKLNQCEHFPILNVSLSYLCDYKTVNWFHGTSAASTS